jgi:hypothetical protein
MGAGKRERVRSESHATVRLTGIIADKLARLWALEVGEIKAIDICCLHLVKQTNIKKMAVSKEALKKHNFNKPCG